MTTAENYLKAWADQTLRPVIREILRDELADIIPGVAGITSLPLAHINISSAPILSANQVKEMTGWPNGTFYAKVAQMPEGVVIRGKSKRLLFDREKFIQWLQTPVQP